jgi:hypothetical protein
MTGQVRMYCAALAALAAVSPLGGCGKLLGIDDLEGPRTDARPPDDGTPDTQNGNTLRITGRVQGGDITAPMTVGGAVVELYELPGEARVATATSLADGTYTLDAPFSGTPINGFLAVTDGGQFNFNPTFHYLPRPLSAAAQLDLMMFDGSYLKGLATNYGVSHDPGRPALFVQVTDAAGMPVPGVQVLTQIGPLFPFRYNGFFGIPDPGANATWDDGRAFLFDVPNDNTFQVTGDRPGQTFGPASTRKMEAATCHFLTIRPN